MKAIDLTGQRFGRLVALHTVASKGGGRRWLCLCDCGKQTTALTRDLRSGHTFGCGCGRVKHGWFGTKTYTAWAAMIQRCRNPKSQAFANYGARGIKVCERWLQFESFIADMGEAPADRSLDRIDNDGDYEPSNCRWATDEEQNRNRRPTRPYVRGGRVVNA